MTFLRNIFQSLHNPLFYQRIFYAEEGGIGFAYLLKLLVLCWFLVALVLTALVLEAQRNPEESPLMLPTQLLRKISPQFPPMTIENGQMHIDGQQPLTLYDPETGLPLMIIDTTGNTGSLSLEGGQTARLLLTRNTIRLRYEGEDLTYEIPKEVNTVIDSGKLEEWANFLEKMMPYAPFIMLPFNVFGHLFSLAGGWLLMAVIAFIAIRPAIEETTFRSCLRISAYALTASTLLKMLMIGSGFQPFSAPHYLLLAVNLLYLFFAISAIHKTAK